MELKSTVITLSNLLKLNFDPEFESFVESPKNHLSIPDYQREYKWEKAKIKTFVNNIMQRSKFLGIITTEVSNGDSLSVVDGQQRLTSIILVLVHLFNLCADEGETETQVEIQQLISSEINNHTAFKLINGSVGEYLHLITDENGHIKIEVRIDPNHDIYRQAKKFDEACKIIQDAFETRDRTITLDRYKQRLVDCEILLFTKKSTDHKQQDSIEEIYIDINEKAQQLDPEDIFKGHCFADCKTTAQQDKVKVLWCSIKQHFFSMDNFLKKVSMGVFLHYYLLTQEAIMSDRKDINEKLTIDGINVIKYRYDSPSKIMDLLKSIERYQHNLLDFAMNLNVIGHNFSEIMTTTAQTLGNKSDHIKELNAILQDVFECNQNMFKLPLFYLIDLYYCKEQVDKLTYNQLSGFVYLYYIYLFLFSRIGGLRQRRFIPNKLIYKISMEEDFLIQFIQEILDYSKSFSFEGDSMKDKTTRKHLYGIFDSFECTSKNTPAIHDNELSFKLRLFPEIYNHEHLVINQSRTIKWCSINKNEYDFSSNDFSDCEMWGKQYIGWPNYIWIDNTYNRDILKNKDIVNKIILLRGSAIASDCPTKDTYAKRHAHIEIICQHIMKTKGFDALRAAYENDESKTNVLNYYKHFIEEYFNQENTKSLLNEFEMQFRGILDSLKSIVQ